MRVRHAPCKAHLRHVHKDKTGAKRFGGTCRDKIRTRKGHPQKHIKRLCGNSEGTTIEPSGTEKERKRERKKDILPATPRRPAWKYFILGIE